MEQFQSQEEYLLLELTLPMVVTMVVSEAEIPVAPLRQLWLLSKFTECFIYKGGLHILYIKNM